MPHVLRSSRFHAWDSVRLYKLRSNGTWRHLWDSRVDRFTLEEVCKRHGTVPDPCRTEDGGVSSEVSHHGWAGPHETALDSPVGLMRSGAASSSSLRDSRPRPW